MMSIPIDQSGQALDDSALLRLLLDVNPDHIYFKDRAGRFLRVNRAVANWFGLRDPADAVGRSDGDFFTEEHARQARRDEEHILQTGEPIVGKVEEETWPDGRRTWVSSTKLPLRDGEGRMIGTFGISRDVTEQHLKDEQLARYAEDLRESNARYQQELDLAAEVMNALSAVRLEAYPEHDADPRVRCHYRYSAADALSGDFYVVAPFGASSVLVLLCDVMGHGVSAALVAAVMRVWVGQLIRAETNPSALLAALNRRLRGLFTKPDTLRFATTFCGVLDTATGRLRYASAGHPAPLLIDRAHARIQMLHTGQGQGPGLGLFADAEYPEQECVLPSPVTLLVFSDGAIEGWIDPHSETEPEQELCDWLCARPLPPTPDLLHELLSQAAAPRAGASRDDICLVALDYLHPAHPKGTP